MSQGVLVTVQYLCLIAMMFFVPADPNTCRSIGLLMLAFIAHGLSHNIKERNVKTKG